MQRQLSLSQRLDAIEKLKSSIDVILQKEGIPEKEENEIVKLIRDGVDLAIYENPWFTGEFVSKAMEGISSLLGQVRAEELNTRYPGIDLSREKLPRIALMMAGNIPAVGFGDLLCIWITGLPCICRLSADDARLLPALQNALEMIEPGFQGMVEFTRERIHDFDAVIATGSTNTSRYYQYYFSKWPSVIRSNRSSVAVLSGHESEEDLRGLADDICLYFGMGCRSISKLYLPQGFDPHRLIEALRTGYDHLKQHNKFRNNYEYQSSIYLINSIPFIEAGPILLREHSSLTSPLAVVHFEMYSDIDHVAHTIDLERENIQCVVTTSDQFAEAARPGFAQRPGLYDFADGVDIIGFILQL